MPFRLTLSQRILALITLTLVAGAFVVVQHTERTLETSLFQQIKKQALVFLHGLRGRVTDLADPTDPDALQALVEETLRSPGPLDFSIHRIYLFDRSGRILADSGRLETHKDDMAEYLEPVFQKGLPYFSHDVQFPDEIGAAPVLDVVVPVRSGGVVVAALEVELALDKTLALIRQMDNRYEQEILSLTAGTTVLVVALLWWLIHRGLLRPIGVLGAVTARIGAGDLQARARGLPRNELGSLGEAINDMADNIAGLLERQEQAYLEALRALSRALEAKDRYTAGHSGRVTRYAVKLGRRLGLAADKLEVLRQGALMHDLGKIGIPDHILNKPEPLTEAEYEIMKTHPVLTATIMRPLKRLKEHAEIAAWHHERWDGKGYPDGLRGEAIPLLARIVAIADAWDAMTGDRVYRKGMPAERAVALLEAERNSGQFDPRLLDHFTALIREEIQARAAGSRPRPLRANGAA